MRDLASSISYQPHVLQDLVPPYSCYCRGRTMPYESSHSATATSHLSSSAGRWGVIKSVRRIQAGDPDFDMGGYKVGPLGQYVEPGTSHTPSTSEQQFMAQVNAAVLLSVPIHTQTVPVTRITPGVCCFVVHHLGRHRACVTPFILPEIKSLCTCTWHHTLLQCLLQVPLGKYPIQLFHAVCHSSPKIQRGEKIDMQLWKLSVRSLTIWWKRLSFLVCIQACLFHSNAGTNGSAWCWSSTAAELSLVWGPKGWAQKHKGLPTERTQNAPSESQLPGQRKPKHDCTSFFRKLHHMVPLY